MNRFGDLQMSQPFPGPMGTQTESGESEGEFGRGGAGGGRGGGRSYGGALGGSASSRGGPVGRGRMSNAAVGMRRPLGPLGRPTPSGGWRTKSPGRRTRPPYPGRRYGYPIGYPFGIATSSSDSVPLDPEQARFVQQCLNRVMRSRLRLTGRLTAATRSLLRAFQRQSGLAATGALDEDTDAALRAACGASAGIGSTPAASPVSRQGPPTSSDGAQVPGGAEPASDAAPGGEQPSAGAGAPEGDEEEEFSDFLNRIGERAGQAWDTMTAKMGSLTGSRIIDLTATADKTLRKGMRDPKKVYALVIHQMACCFKPKDPLKRFLNLNAHFAILADGRILQVHPTSALLWASNGFNAGSIAVEFAGNFPNTAGKWWEGAKFGRDHVTKEQLKAGRDLVDHLQRTMGITHVLAHRQSSATRENDPGPDIWYHVGQWAIENRGMKDGGPAFKVAKGNPIPESWRNWGRPGVKRELFEHEMAGLDARHEVRLGEAGGSHTDAVRPVQRALNQLLGLRIPEDGMETPETRSAIRLFEKRLRLPVSGRVTPGIIAALSQTLGGPGAGQGQPVLQGQSETQLEGETATERVLNTMPSGLGATWQSIGGLAKAAQQARGPGVYVFLFPPGHPRQAYVGQTKDLGKRLKAHLWCLTHMGLSPTGYRVRVAAIADESRRKAVEAYINGRLMPRDKVTNRKLNELEQEVWGET